VSHSTVPLQDNAAVSGVILSDPLDGEVGIIVSVTLALPDRDRLDYFFIQYAFVYASVVTAIETVITTAITRENQ